MIFSSDYHCEKTSINYLHIIPLNPFLLLQSVNIIFSSIVLSFIQICAENIAMRFYQYIALVLIFLFFHSCKEVNGNAELTATNSQSVPTTYRVVIDPGHGGKQLNPDSVYGDKWDALSARYLNPFRTGAFFKNMKEYEEVYELAVEAQRYLTLLKTERGRIMFHKILRKYSPNAKKPKVAIEVFISRKANYYNNYKNIQEDPNAPYRLFDYPDIRSEQIQKGTISNINAYKPHLVVSLHLTKGGAPKSGGMAAVVTPSYYTYKTALDYARSSKEKQNEIKKHFMRATYRNWFLSGLDRAHFAWFLSDASIYFTGYRTKPSGLAPNKNQFYGYRHNMITWAYRDDASWVEKAKLHNSNSPYASYLKNFKAEGKFWQREKSQEEKWRREGGYEKYGGDNLYASQEILRYIRQSLLINGKKDFSNLPPILYPYLSTWSVPTYINAISAYLEIAYINQDADYQRMLTMKDEMAEAIAVGIYSLFYSLEQDSANRKKQLPVGKSINFERYKNYFEKVVKE